MLFRFPIRFSSLISLKPSKNGILKNALNYVHIIILLETVDLGILKECDVKFKFCSFAFIFQLLDFRKTCQVLHLYYISVNKLLLSCIGLLVEICTRFDLPGDIHKQHAL